MAKYYRAQAIELATPTARMKGQAIERAAPSAGLKGQAMMEYLVTYGWALLALFLVIALLIASGAFSPNSFSTQECTFQPGLPCGPFILYSEPDSAGAGAKTVLRFSLTNGLGFPINVTGVNYTITDIGTEGKRTIAGDFSSTRYVPQGASVNFTQNFSGARQPSVKAFKSIYATVSYLNCRVSPCTGPYHVSGRISAVVEQKQ